MEKSKPELEDIAEDLKSYVNTTLELYKLKATEKGAEMASQVIINLVLAVMAAMVLLFASFALALLLSEYFDRMYLGFVIVAGVYALLGMIVYLLKNTWLKGTLVDSIIKSVYS